MLSFIVTAIFSGAVYLLLTAGSGSVLRFWSSQELLVALLVAIAVGFVARTYFASARRRAASNPLRWLQAVAYVLGPFFLEMAKANLDVAYRVITGRIRPGIVRVKTGMKTDMGALLMANSITLTPGTLTVNVDEDTNDLFIHMINVPEGFEARETIEAREVFSMFDCPAWIRRIAE
ncbi:MAG: Na+/H+ antiporter subunit E [Kiritimatiellia bacterium]